MKKIFLTSGLVICMACPAFATKDLDTSGHASGVTQGEECVNEVLGVYDAPQNNPVQLEAKWSANNYTITFDKGTVGSHDVSTYVSGTTSDIPVTFDSTGVTLANGWSATGYHFTGWNSPTNLANNDRPLVPTTYAGTANSSDANANYTSPVLASYGYAPDSGSSVTLTAQWAANQYNVIYHAADQIVCDANSACTSGTFTQTNGATFDAQYSPLSLANAHMSANTGYTFLGWSTDSAATVTRTGTSNAGTFTGAYTGANPWTRTSDLDLYAVYLANNYTVTYTEGTHGTGNGSADTLTYDTAYSIKTLANAGVAAAAGYHFTEWSGSNSQTYANEATIVANTITSNLTLTAQYAANVTNVTYSCGSQTGVTGTAPSFGNEANNHTNTATFNESYTFAANSGNCAVPGYTFQGWSCTGLDGTQTAGSSATWAYTGAHNGNITCTAVFDANRIYVNWYKNDGSEETTPYSENSCIYDGSLQVPTAPSRNGYQFSGWTVRPAAQQSND